MIFSFLIVSYSVGLIWNKNLLPNKIIFEFETHNINISFYVGSKYIKFEKKHLNGKWGNTRWISFGVEMTPFFNNKKRGFFFNLRNDFRFNSSLFNDGYDKLDSYTFSLGLLYNIPFHFKEKDFNFRIKFSPLLRFSWSKYNSEYGDIYQESVIKTWYLNLGRSHIYFILSILL